MLRKVLGDCYQWKEKERRSKGDKTVFPENFLGICIVREGIWKGHILVSDIEELENLDTSEIHAMVSQQ